MILGWCLIVAGILGAALLAWAVHRREKVEALMETCRFCVKRNGIGFWQRGESGELVRRWMNYQPADCLCDECWFLIEKVYRRRMYV